jgi:glutamate-1-semialdehyde aminotransferase
MIKSRGLGDTIEKITKATGIKYVVDKVTGVFRIPCGCATRKKTLNKIFPYKAK